jgi:hypothetical protein
MNLWCTAIVVAIVLGGSNVAVVARDAFITIVNSAGEIDGACVLGRSLWEQEHSNHIEYAPYLEGHRSYSQEYEQDVVDSYDRVLLLNKSVVEYRLDYRSLFISQCRWSHVIVFTGNSGFHPFSLVQYDRVMYLHHNTFVRYPIDSLFECVGNAYDISAKRRKLNSWDWFKACALQDEPNIGKMSWNFLPTILIFTPSMVLFEDCGLDCVPATYFFWQCENDQIVPLNQTISNRTHELVMFDRVAIYPPLWTNPKSHSFVEHPRKFPNVYRTWPMKNCQRLQDMYNVPAFSSHYEKAPEKAPLITIATPTNWKTWLFSGYYDEWRTLYFLPGGIELTVFFMLAFTVCLALLYSLHVHLFGARNIPISVSFGQTLTAIAIPFLVVCAVLLCGIFDFSARMPANYAPFNLLIGSVTSTNVQLATIVCWLIFFQFNLAQIIMICIGQWIVHTPELTIITGFLAYIYVVYPLYAFLLYKLLNTRELDIPILL